MMESIPDDLKKKYIERRQTDLNECLSHLKSKNFTSLEKLGHKMKGNGGTFGYLIITKIGDKIEKGSKTKNEPLIQEALKELASWIKSN